MKKRLAILVGGSLALWWVLAYPAYHLGGVPGLVSSAVALGLCLAPTVATLVWANWASGSSPEQQLLMVLGGTGVRMAFVLGSALILYCTEAYFQNMSFWMWILVFYLLTLALEIVLLVVPGRVSSSQPSELAES